MNKFKTNIPGFDMLFHGGLQIDSSMNDLRERIASQKDNSISGDDCVSKEDRGMVIVIRGAKGTYKTTFAMHMMYGLFRSLQNRNIATGESLFYSINKETEDLNDAFLDMIISQALKSIIRQYRHDKFNSEKICEGVEGRREIQALINFLFDLENATSDNETRDEARIRIAQLGDKLPKLICEGVILYNLRTNALHYKRAFIADDANNLIATRRYNSVKKYLEYLKKPENDRLRNSTNPVVRDFIRNLCDITFNADEDCDEKLRLDVPRNPMTIYRAIEFDIYNKGYEKEQSSGEFKNSDANDRYDILVIDGFSQLRSDDLEELPYSNLTTLVRKLSKISILVFDEREGARCDGDIVIDTRTVSSDLEEYMYHELRITKSVFQTSVLGWHQYKKRDEGIEVFPSTHLLLSKRYYISNKSHQIGQSLFEASYDQFLEIKKFQDCVENNVEDCPTQTPYWEYLRNCNLWPEEQQRKIFEKYANKIRYSEITGKDNGLSDMDAKEILEKILFLKNLDKYYELDASSVANCSYSCNDNEPQPRHHIWLDHFPSTVIIGNPNSYKRTLALATAYKLAQQKIHTLFFLFDKDEMDMRTKMVCPGFHGDENECQRIFKDGCVKCSKYIHMYDLRMGCLSAEEFFAILLEQISFYCKPTEKTGVETKCFHIILDDIQKIDFSFPFIKANKLFLSALLSICHAHKVKLTILCDKSSSLVHEVCSLVDNVIDIKREENDIYNIELNVERGCNDGIPSRILKYNISDILHLFACDGKTMYLNSYIPLADGATGENIETIHNHKTHGKSRIDAKIIGSMKEYWRMTVNNIVNENPAHGTFEKKF